MQETQYLGGSEPFYECITSSRYTRDTTKYAMSVVKVLIHCATTRVQNHLAIRIILQDTVTLAAF